MNIQSDQDSAALGREEGMRAAAKGEAQMVMTNVIAFPSAMNSPIPRTPALCDTSLRFAAAGRQLAISMLQIEQMAIDRGVALPDRLIKEGSRIAVEALVAGFLAVDQQAIVDLTERTFQLHEAITEWVSAELLVPL